MSKVNEIREIVKKVFLNKKKIYTLNYLLKEIGYDSNINHIYYIVYGNCGVVVSFNVSDIGVYDAMLTSDMATNTYELEWWHDFIGDIKEEFRKTRLEEMSKMMLEAYRDE